MIINTGQRTDIPAFYSKWFINRIKEGLKTDTIKEAKQESCIDNTITLF